MIDTTERPAIVIGTPLYRGGLGEVGHVCRVLAATPRTFMLGTGAMRPVEAEYEVCFAERLSTLPDAIIAPWVAAAHCMGLPVLAPADLEARRLAAVDGMARARTTAQEEREAREARAAAFREEAAAKVPPWAKAVIVAELHQDDSDTMSDYHGHKTLRRVVLAWSAHTRDLFPELRKASLNFPDTAHLATVPEKADHREKYSMGGGNYLKDGFRDSSGWKVQKERLWQGVNGISPAEWSLPVDSTVTQAAADAGAVAVQAGAFRVEEHTNTRKGFRYWLAIMAERVERDDFDRLTKAARALGGWYSRPWDGIPGGFAFKVEAQALAFTGGQPAETPAPTRTASAPTSAPGIGDKLQALADGMESEIADKMRDRQTNTPKRRREADSARLDGYRLQRTQQGLRALADHHDAGTVPAVLASVKSKAGAFALAYAEIVNSGGYYDAGHETGKPGRDTPEALAFWALLKGRTDAERAADDLRRKVDDLKFANIPGYFPTPGAIVARMFDAANIPPGQAVAILEPEAGSGAILDQAAHRYPAAILTAYERHASLSSILTAKGYRVAGGDFLAASPAPLFDYVMMNPPFEKGQDIEHVRHAFAFLKPGGRLVAIMSPGPFYRQDRKATEFREWFDSRGIREDIEAGAFKESGTDVATVLAVIDR